MRVPWTTPSLRLLAAKDFISSSRRASATSGAAAVDPSSSPFATARMREQDFSPVAFKAERDEEVIFCGCKHTRQPAVLRWQPQQPPRRPSRPTIPRASIIGGQLGRAGRGPIVRLDGNCYVFSTARAHLRRPGSDAVLPVVTPANGALFQSQFYARIAHGSSPVISADGRAYRAVRECGHGPHRDRRPALPGRAAHRRLCAAGRDLSHRVSRARSRYSSRTVPGARILSGRSAWRAHSMPITHIDAPASKRRSVTRWPSVTISC